MFSEITAGTGYSPFRTKAQEGSGAGNPELAEIVAGLIFRRVPHDSDEWRDYYRKSALAHGWSPDVVEAIVESHYRNEENRYD